jgi:hypothetical protein
MTCGTVCPSHAESLDPIILSSSTGIEVEIVAVHQVGPEGLTFSPKPDKPLIGSNKLKTITTKWVNIDLGSIEAYPELSRAYAEAEQGKTIRVEIGPHFHKISDSMERISRDLPRARYWAGAERRSMSLTQLVRDHGQYRPSKWSIPEKERDRTLTTWKKEYEDLENLSYRADIIRFRHKIHSAIQSLEKISSREQAFNISAAKDLSELLSAED